MPGLSSFPLVDFGYFGLYFHLLVGFDGFLGSDFHQDYEQTNSGEKCGVSSSKSNFSVRGNQCICDFYSDTKCTFVVL